MRQASKRIPEALKRQSGIFAEPHAGIIPLKRRSAGGRELQMQLCAASVQDRRPTPDAAATTPLKCAQPYIA